METIKCACGCGAELNKFDQYGRERSFANGHNNRKYQDPTQHKREWNHRNRESRYEYKKRYHRKRKIALLQYKGSKCEQCGIKYSGTNAAIFHFHHLDPTKKEFAVGNQVVNKAWAKLIAEVDKCMLLCANCHELRHGEPF